MNALRPWNHWGVDAAGLALCGIVALAGYALGVAPTLRAGRERAQQRAELARLETEADQQAAGLRAARDRLAWTRRGAEDSPVILRPADELNQRIGRITALADAGGVRIDQIEPGPPTKAARFTSVPLRLTATGSYVSVGRLLARLHDTYRDTAVSALKLSGNPADPKAKATLALDLTWYAAPAGQADGANSSVSAAAAPAESAANP